MEFLAGINKADYFQFGFGVLFVTWLGGVIRSYVSMIFDSLQRRFYYTARLSYPDTIFINFLDWVGTQNIIYGNREVSVMTRYDNIESSSEMDASLKLLPTGTQWFKFKGYFVSMTRTLSDKKSLDGMKEDYLQVSVYFGNRSVINDLLDTVNEYSKTTSSHQTKIFSLEPNSLYWECISIQNKRELDSVFLEKSVRSLVMDDLNSFIHGKEWYSKTGVPYRRGYLLYGPPGTGKTSFILSIAGNFGKSISIMNLTKGVNDSNITSIIQKCQKNTILVLEDVDAAFIHRSQQNRGSTLTFSGLLNAIDGLAASDGRILIMTTNHVERLSTALIRPGRIDLKVKFDFATPYQIKKMFTRFFEDPKFLPIMEKLLVELKDKQISTAQLQGWFIFNRNTPENLLDSINELSLIQINKEEKQDQPVDVNHLDQPVEQPPVNNSKEENQEEDDSPSSSGDEEEKKRANLIRIMRRRKTFNHV